MKFSPLVAYTAAAPRRAAFFALFYLIGCAVWIYYKRTQRRQPAS